MPKLFANSDQMPHSVLKWARHFYIPRQYFILQFSKAFSPADQNIVDADETAHNELYTVDPVKMAIKELSSILFKCFPFCALDENHYLHQ